MNANRTNHSKVINRAIHILFHGRVNTLLTLNGRSLTSYIVNKLDNNEKETLDEDINLDEISKVIKILKPNKSPGEDGIISEFY